MNKSRLLLLYRHAIYSHVYSSCTAEKADRERECVCELLIRTVNRSKSQRYQEAAPTRDVTDAEDDARGDGDSGDNNDDNDNDGD